MKRKIYCFTLAMLMLFSSLLVHFINEPIVHAFDSTGWTAGSEGWFESDVMNQDNVAADGSLIFTFSNFPTNDREYHYHYAATAASVAIQICVDGIWHDTYKDANGQIKPLTGSVDANGEPDFIKDQQLEDSSTIITIGLNKDSAGWIWEDNNQPGRNGWAHIPGEQHTYQIRFYAKQYSFCMA